MLLLDTLSPILICRCDIYSLAPESAHGVGLFLSTRVSGTRIDASYMQHGFRTLGYSYLMALASRRWLINYRNINRVSPIVAPSLLLMKLHSVIGRRTASSDLCRQQLSANLIPVVQQC